jgi:hypothetical protein
MPAGGLTCAARSELALRFPFRIKDPPQGAVHGYNRPTFPSCHNTRLP